MKLRVWISVCATAVVASCGGSSVPAAPDQIAQVSGTWDGAIIQTAASGGECLGVQWASANGQASRFIVAIAQNGASLTATEDKNLGFPPYALNCTYSGTAGSNTVTLTLASCSIQRVQFQCADGRPRDVFLASRSFTGAPVTDNGSVRLTGTTTESWNVYLPGNANSIGVLSVNYSVGISRVSTTP